MRRMTRRLLGHGAILWRGLRTACERYCAHRAARHALEPPLSRRAFYEDAQRRKWSGVSRCC